MARIWRKAVAFAASALVAAGSAAAIPTVERSTTDARPATENVNDNRPLFVELNAAKSQATFAVPCPGCLGGIAKTGDDEALVFDIEVFPSEQPCGESNITINGEPLEQQWDAVHASGSGVIPTTFEQYLDVPADVQLSWESSCLWSLEAPSPDSSDAAQLLTVRIQRIGSLPVSQPAGFTLALKTLKPELLRLSTSPDITALLPSVSEEWRDPPSDRRIVSFNPWIDANDDDEEEEPTSTVEQELQEIEALEEQIWALKELIKAKKHRVGSHLGKACKSLNAELKQCDSLACIFHAIVHRTKALVQYVKIRYQSHDHHDMMKQFSPYKKPVGQSVTVTEVHPDEVDDLPPYASTTSLPSYDGPHQNDTRTPEKLKSPSSVSEQPARIWVHSSSQGEDEHGPFVKFVVKIFAGAALVVSVVFLIVRKCVCCCSPRRKQDRLFEREQRRAERAYQRAACKQRWKNLFRRSWKDQRRIEDYEEKRALIIDQESRLDAVMQEEIRQLQRAHGVVNDLVQAEEGRVSHSPTLTNNSEQGYPASRVRNGANTGFVTQRVRGGSLGSDSSGGYTLSRSNSLPSYHTDPESDRESLNTLPPSYTSDTEDESDNETRVTSGFRGYTPSNTSGSASPQTTSNRVGATTTASTTSNGRWTPNSSVVDISVRPSCETMRPSLSYDTESDDDSDADSAVVEARRYL